MPPHSPIVSTRLLRYEALDMADNNSNPDRSAGTTFAEAVARDKDKRGKARSLRPLAYLWPYVWTYKAWLIAFFVFLVLSAAASLTLPLIFKVIVDCGFGDNAENVTYCQRIARSGAPTLATYFKFAIGFVVIFSALG